MRLIKLKAINLIYSNVAEDEYPEWADSVTYNKGDRVKVTDKTPYKIYESLIDNNIGNYPPDSVWTELQANYAEWDKTAIYSKGDRVKVSYASDGITLLDTPTAFESLTDNNKGNYPPDDTTNWKHLNLWKEIGSTNRWAMFDEYVLSQTENNGKIEVVVDFANCDAFALFNLHASSVDWELYDGDHTNSDNLIQSESISLQEPVQDWYEYFYLPISYKQDVCVVPLAVLENGKLKVTINPLSGFSKCGMMTVGRSRYLGDSAFNVHIGILDWSKKETDSRGRATLKEGNFAKLIECDVWLQTTAIDIVRKVLTDVRAVPAVYNFNNDNPDAVFDSLIVYGFFKDFDVILSGPAISRLSIQIEGLI